MLSFLACLQLAHFRTIEDASANKLTHNFRAVQAIGDRTVYHYDSGAMASSTASLVLLTVASVVAKLLS